MKSSEIFNAIERIAETSKVKEKLDLLAARIDDVDFFNVITYSMNPFITFGIAKRFASKPFSKEGGEFDKKTWGMLDDLAARRLTGNNAKDAIVAELSILNSDSQELLWRILLKDLRANFGASTVNKVVKGLLPVFPYQRCSLPKEVKLSEWDWGSGVISQEKADGLYLNLDKDSSGVVVMTTRQGTPVDISKFPEIELAAKRLDVNTQTHGEILVEVDGVIAKRAIGNGIINRIQSGGEFADNERPVYRVWDQIPLDQVKPKAKITSLYGRRLYALRDQLYRLSYEGVVFEYHPSKSLAIDLIETKIVHSLKEAFKHYIEKLKQKKEGTIIKKPDAIWKDGTSKEQVKLKLDAPCELEVFGYEEGNGKNAKTFGSLKCRTSDHLLEVNVSGFTDEMRAAIWANIDEWTGCGEGGAIITVTSNDIQLPSPSNEKYSLFLPRFAERRYDKSEADSLPRVFEQFDNAIKKLEDME